LHGHLLKGSVIVKLDRGGFDSLLFLRAHRTVLTVQRNVKLCLHWCKLIKSGLHCALQFVLYNSSFDWLYLKFLTKYFRGCLIEFWHIYRVFIDEVNLNVKNLGLCNNLLDVYNSFKTTVGRKNDIWHVFKPSILPLWNYFRKPSETRPLLDRQYGLKSTPDNK